RVGVVTASIASGTGQRHGTAFTAAVRPTGVGRGVRVGQSELRITGSDPALIVSDGERQLEGAIIGAADAGAQLSVVGAEVAGCTWVHTGLSGVGPLVGMGVAPPCIAL